jgi:hypothetical protein
MSIPNASEKRPYRGSWAKEQLKMGDVGDENRTALTLLQSELARLHDASTETSRRHHSWVSWFFGIQMLLLGLFASKKDVDDASLDIRVVAAALIIMNILFLISTLQIRAFDARQAEKASAVCRAIEQRAGAVGVTFDVTSGVASEIVRPVLGFACIGLVIAVMMWSYVIVMASVNCGRVAPG